jgi:hypothetical protein
MLRYPLWLSSRSQPHDLRFLSLYSNSRGAFFSLSVLAELTMHVDGSYDLMTPCLGLIRYTRVARLNPRLVRQPDNTLDPFPLMTSLLAFPLSNEAEPARS